MIADNKIRDIRTHLLDDTSGLVTQNTGSGKGQAPFHDRKVAMANPGRGGLYEHLAGTRFVDLHLF
jgi:hypothetical protein